MRRPAPDRCARPAALRQCHPRPAGLDAQARATWVSRADTPAEAQALLTGFWHRPDTAGPLAAL
ncbi:hypothetical protein RAA17_18260 [Komagataeibacter rhaeticus]|nr:hypothetical protein [Komagataeibacter rhaeticus]